jgi:hypothetical protein
LKVIITVPTGNSALRGLRILPVTAVLLAAILLVSNLPFVPGGMHSYLSAAPLAFAGIGYGLLQIRARPARGILWKRLMLAATFLLWAMDQLLPPGRMATTIGDVVIAAYVLDLYWLVQEQEA